MIRCPKCGSTTIEGPRYMRFAVGQWPDGLRYTCARCGYIKDEPTNDRVEQSP